VSLWLALILWLDPASASVHLSDNVAGKHENFAPVIRAAQALVGYEGLPEAVPCGGPEGVLDGDTIEVDSASIRLSSSV
jgi:hypothetical protein